MPKRIVLNSKATVEKLKNLKTFTWSTLQHNSQTFVVTQLAMTKKTPQNYQRVIKAYAKANNLKNVDVKTQYKNSLLYMTSESFNTFFTSLDKHIPSAVEASEVLQYQFTDSAMEEVTNYDKKLLNDLPNLTWYVLEGENSSKMYIADLSSHVDSDKNISNYYASAFNRYAREIGRNQEMKAKNQSNYHLLLINEADFKNYFDARSLSLPKTVPATAELVKRLQDKKVKKVDEHDRNNLMKLTTLDWFHLTEKKVDYVLTVFETGFEKINHTVSSISHVGNATNQPEVKGNSIAKYGLLYLTQDAFKKLFEYLETPIPKTQSANDAHLEMFTKRRKRVKHRKKMLVDKQFSKCKMLNIQPANDASQSIKLEQNDWINEFLKYNITHVTESQSEMFLATNAEPQRSYLVNFNMSIKNLLSQPEPQVLESNDKSQIRFIINR